MTLETLTPDPAWDAHAHAGAVDALASLRPSDRILVWCDDGCGDCQALLPAFAAALEAANVVDAVVQYPVERLPEGEKRGPKVDEYGIKRIPTVVVERGDVEIARFVEGDEGPILEGLARQLGPVERPS